jgi:hypothetical protein
MVQQRNAYDPISGNVPDAESVFMISILRRLTVEIAGTRPILQPVQPFFKNKRSDFQSSVVDPLCVRYRMVPGHGFSSCNAI